MKRRNKRIGAEEGAGLPMYDLLFGKRNFDLMRRVDHTGLRD
jgi:hypothetical protein